ncbi:MAG TPA: flagellar basal body L-ring protein FlgH [Gemmatimonadales bacterium]|nr:flagellar basal body L-ring protein FlgH [Gemmatimonadales bacterium]
MMRRSHLAFGATCLLPLSLAAQAPATPATPDSTAASAPPVVVAVDVRQSWTSDRRPLRLGDILTIVVDESALASEQASEVARSDRNQKASLDGAPFPADLRSLGMGLNSSSNNTGTTRRAGSLLAVVSVQVVSVDPNGVAKVEGTKLVTVDGRDQELRISGLVRSEDVSQQNTILSSRIANGEIFYKGKNISPKKGIFGKLLGLLWP